MAAHIITFKPIGIRACASSDHSRSESRNSESPSWWSPIFGWSNEPDYIKNNEIEVGSSIDLKSASNRFAPGCFTAEKAKQLRLQTQGSTFFHDAMYHSAIASWLATDRKCRQVDNGEF